MYTVQKNLTRLHNLHSTYFLDPKELREVQKKLKKGEYQVYAPYCDSEKKVLYTGSIPEVLLYEIKINVPVRHQDILGSLYSLDILSELFGDILIIDNHYYVYILPMIRNYFEANFLMVKNASIELEEIPLSTLENYQRNYELLEFIVSSNRIDTIISSICHCNRKEILHMISKKDIILNYDYLKDASYRLRENDIFSIRRIGKFRYHGITKTTKKNHYVIQIFQYL